MSAALEFVDALGAPIFPVNPKTNTPIIPSAHPQGDPLRGRCKGDCGQDGHGFHDATTDRDRITAWWQRWPHASIGARTGVTFDVLDIDHTDFVEGVADLPDCSTDGGPVVLSGGGKFHLYFRPSGLGRHIRFSKHCDWLGTDGYVVAPPSKHPSGGCYRWETPPTVTLTDAPSALLDAVREAVRHDKKAPAGRPRINDPATLCVGTPGKWSPSGLIARMATAVEGERNDVLHWCAWRAGFDVHEGKVSGTEALAALGQIATVAENTGLGSKAVDATVESGYRAGVNGQRKAVSA